MYRIFVIVPILALATVAFARSSQAKPTPEKVDRRNDYVPAPTSVPSSSNNVESNVKDFVNGFLRTFNADVNSSASPSVNNTKNGMEMRQSYSNGARDSQNLLFGGDIYPHDAGPLFTPTYLKPVGTKSSLPPLPALPTPLTPTTLPTTASSLDGLASKLPALLSVIQGLVGGAQPGLLSGLTPILNTVIPLLVAAKNSVRGVITKLLVPLVILVLINVEVLALAWWLWEDCPPAPVSLPSPAQLPTHLPSLSVYDHQPSPYFKTNRFLNARPQSSMYRYL